MEKRILPEESVVVATGYGRVSVPYAAKCVTEITCHAKGACYIHKNENMLLIDIGGQDTKIIRIENGMVTDFLMINVPPEQAVSLKSWQIHYL